MSLEHDITQIKTLIEAKPIFKAAGPEQRAQRLFPDRPDLWPKYAAALSAATPGDMWALTQRVRREADAPRRARVAARNQAYYSSIPYTYDDIKNLTAYKKIMSLPHVVDTTSNAMKNHRTTSFDVVIDNEHWQQYRVFANGYLRYGTQAHAGVLIRGAYARSLEAYNSLMERLYRTMVRFITKNRNKVGLPAWQN